MRHRVEHVLSKDQVKHIRKIGKWPAHFDAALGTAALDNDDGRGGGDGSGADGSGGGGGSTGNGHVDAVDSVGGGVNGSSNNGDGGASHSGGEAEEWESGSEDSMGELFVNNNRAAMQRLRLHNDDDEDDDSSDGGNDSGHNVDAEPVVAASEAQQKPARC